MPYKEGSITQTTYSLKMKEEWRKIKGFDNYYISNLGNVRNHKGHVLTPELSSVGYYRVHLSKSGKAKHYSVHRLVADAFLGERKGCNIVNHKDGCKTNNISTNLEWCTHSSNLQHAYDFGLRIGNFGDKNGQTKLSIEDVKEIRTTHKKRKTQTKVCVFSVIHAFRAIDRF